MRGVRGSVGLVGGSIFVLIRGRRWCGCWSRRRWGRGVGVGMRTTLVSVTGGMSARVEGLLAGMVRRMGIADISGMAVLLGDGQRALGDRVALAHPQISSSPAPSPPPPRAHGAGPRSLFLAPGDQDRNRQGVGRNLMELWGMGLYGCHSLQGY